MEALYGSHISRDRILQELPTTLKAMRFLLVGHESLYMKDSTHWLRDTILASQDTVRKAR